MADYIPITDELLERARNDRTLRRRMVSEHLDRLMVAMSRARNRATTDTETTHLLQEGARLAVKLTEILQKIGGKPVR
jgi:hypothetical protein